MVLINDLKALDFSDLIGPKQAAHCAGTREWAFQEVLSWIAAKERLLWVFGAAGTGKSVVSAMLLKTSGIGKHIGAWHFCNYDSASQSEIRVIISSLAAMLQVNVPGFKIEPKEFGTTPEELFRVCLTEPLWALKSEQPIVILIDALDELPELSLVSMLDILKAVERSSLILPSFVRLIITSRHISGLPKGRSIELEAGEYRNRADLTVYLRKVAKHYVKLDMSTSNMETRLERECELEPGCLAGELEEFEHLITQSKTKYAAALGETDEYKRLETIKEIQSNTLQQTADFLQLCEEAKLAQDQLKRQFAEEWQDDKMVGSTQLQRPKAPVDWIDFAISPGVKDKDSALRKIQDDYQGEIRNMKDLARLTVGCRSVSRTYNLLENELKTKGFDIIGLKNKYKYPTSLGYRDVNLSLRFPVATGKFHICELQVNLEGMLLAKDEAHVFYEKMRKKIPAIVAKYSKNGTDLEKENKRFEKQLDKILKFPVLDCAVRELEVKADGLFLYGSLLRDQLKQEQEAKDVELKKAKQILNEIKLASLDHTPEGQAAIKDAEQKVIDAIKRAEKISFSDLQTRPHGLNGIYTKNFDRMVLNEAIWPQLKDVLAMIVASREPLPAKFAQNDVAQKLLALMFPVRGECFRAMHKSVIDWLRGDLGPHRYLISTNEIEHAHQKMAIMTASYVDDFLKHCDLSQPRPDLLQKFALRQAPYHLCESKREAEAQSMVTNFKWLLTRTALEPLSVISDVEMVSGHVANNFALRLLVSALRLASSEFEKDWRSLPAHLVGRLMHPVKELKNLVLAARHWDGPSQGWWCPMQATLAQADPALKDVLFHPARVTSVHFAPDGQRICSASEDGRVRIWLAGKCVQVLVHGDGHVNSVCWSPDGTKVCSVGIDRNLCIWNVETGERLAIVAANKRVISRHKDDKERVGIFCVAWKSQADGSNGHIASGNDNGSIQIWDETGISLHELSDAHSKHVWSVAWGPGGQLCSGSDDHTVKIWQEQIQHGKKLYKCVQTVDAHKRSIRSVAWSPTGIFASASNDRSVKLWDLQGNHISTLTHPNFIYGVFFRADGKHVYSCCMDGQVRVWDITKVASPMNPVKTFAGHGCGTSAGSTNGVMLCTAGWDSTVRIWDLDAQPGERFLGHSDKVVAASWSPDQQRLCTASRDETLRLWNVNTGECEQVFYGHTGQVPSLVWSRDGSSIVSCSMDRTIRVWNVQNGEVLWSISTQTKREYHKNGFEAVDWVEEKGWFCCGEAHKVRLFYSANGQWQEHEFEGHTDHVKCVSMTANNKICSSGDDKVVRLWNFSFNRWGQLNKKSPSQILTGHESPVRSVAWSLNCQKVCSIDAGYVAKIWDTSGACLSTITAAAAYDDTSFRFITWMFLPSLTKSSDKPLEFATDFKYLFSRRSPHRAFASCAANTHALHLLERRGGQFVTLFGQEDSGLEQKHLSVASSTKAMPASVLYEDTPITFHHQRGSDHRKASAASLETKAPSVAADRARQEANQTARVKTAPINFYRPMHNQADKVQERSLNAPLQTHVAQTAVYRSYKTKPCDFFLRGQCTKGESCTYIH